MIVEVRVPMPVSLAEYERHLFMTSDKLRRTQAAGNVASLRQSGLYVSSTGSAALYTHSAYQIGSWLPAWARAIAGDTLTVEARCWNEFPRSRTEYSVALFEHKLSLVVYSIIVENDTGNLSNALNLTSDQLARRTVQRLDIASSNGIVEFENASAADNPALCQASKMNPPRGPLKPGWSEAKSSPMCCVYKAICVEFRQFGLQTKVELLISQSLIEAYLRLHRSLFCWLDEHATASRDEAIATELQTPLNAVPLLRTEMPSHSSKPMSASPHLITVVSQHALQALKLDSAAGNVFVFPLSSVKFPKQESAIIPAQPAAPPKSGMFSRLRAKL